MTSRTVPASTAGLILAVVIATWFTTLRSPFAEDDWLYLEGVRSSRTVVSFFTGEGVMDHHYRPLSDAVVFFAFRHPVVYHLANLLAVFGAALAVVSVSRRLGLSPPAATAAGVIFAGRDLFFPAMVWASGFSDVGSAAFGLAAIAAALAWSQEGRRGRAAGAVVLAVAAVLTKEIAIVIAPLIALVVLAGAGGVAGGGAGAPGRGPTLGAKLAFLAVVFAAMGAVAFRQWQLASFDDGYGSSLYQLAAGAHTLARLPVYAVWSLAAVREFDAALPALLALVIATAGGWALGFGRGSGGAADRRALLLGLAWFALAISPALVAPQRFHTNYLVIAAAGPCWIVGALLAAPTRSPRLRLVRRALFALVVLAGPVLVGLKGTGRLASGGWVNVPRARHLVDLLRPALPLVAELPPDSRVLLLGGLEMDVRVLGDPRGRGFGPQQVLASAVRVESGRFDLDVLSLPREADLSPAARRAAAELVGEAPDRTRVLDLGPPARDVTGRFGAVR